MSETQAPLIFNIILNTNKREFTLACLETLLKNDYPNQRTIVLDNASQDGSVPAIQSEFPMVEIVHITVNKGYAGNNNVGIQKAMEQGADWIFVLNEDILLAPDCLSRLVQVGESNPGIGIVGPMVYHHNEPEVIQSAGGRLDRYWRSIHLGQNEPDHGQFSSPQVVDWISGCAILVRREVIEQVGVLDEQFFYYWEETEWCLRAREKGWQIVHVPQAKIWHKGVQRDYKPSPDVTYYATRNRFLMLSKHHAPIHVWAYAFVHTLRTLMSWTLKSKWRMMDKHRESMWQGTADFFGQRFGKRPQKES